MKYLKKFEEKALYESYIGNSSILPNVSYTLDTNEVFYNPLVERNNVIRYYSNQKENVKEISGNSIVSHEFNDGVGTIVYSKDVTELSRKFMEDTSITSIELPNSITSIDDYAFDFCGNLTSIKLPSSLEYLGHGVFRYTSLKSIEIPNSVTEINNDTFQGCKSLEYIKLPNSITNIGNYAFYECSSLIELYYDGYKSQYEQIVWGSQVGLALERVICLDGVIEFSEVKTVDHTTLGGSSTANLSLGEQYPYINYFYIYGEDGNLITNAINSHQTINNNYYYFEYDSSVIEVSCSEIKEGMYELSISPLKAGNTELYIYAGPGIKGNVSSVMYVNVTE